MAIVKAFQGVRYDVEKVSLKHVIAPPYDVIGDEYREALVSRSPYNVVNVDLPVGGESRYEDAAELYNSFRDTGVLKKDGKPCFYLYEQTYEFGGRKYVRTGFVGVLKLEELGKGTVFPHEKTLSGPKKDRYDLMMATGANLSQIFGLYMDEDNRLSGLFNQVKKNMPSASAVDDEGTNNAMWAVEDTAFIEQISSFMSDRAIYIADGHHRYETALNYRDARRAAENVPAGEERPYDYVMMMFVNFYDEGLKIFPTHRVVELKPDFNLDDFMLRAKKQFEVTPLADRAAAEAFLAEPEASGSWVMMYEGQHYIMRVDDEAFENLHAVYRKIDTFLLQELAISGLIGKPEEEVLRKEGIWFLQKYDEIVRKMRDKKAMAFLLRGVDIDVVREVSESGLVMPQKSTFFYPKLQTGLVINEF